MNDRIKLGLTHQDIRNIMDDYLNHAKAKGFKISEYNGLGEYCLLLEKIVQIVYAIEIGEKLE